jgi:hypothetical protein
MYFVLALWLLRGRNCGYGQVLGKLVDGLYHRQRAQVLLYDIFPTANWRRVVGHAVHSAVTVGFENLGIEAHAGEQVMDEMFELLGF